ncbi:MAG TPA: hypothetical protein VJZ71_20175 [Phycisphaerae bacterium]|nr:hypothetical protein [Phycisphaerae bacterium]
MRLGVFCAPLVLSCLFGSGCDEDTDPPSQQAVEAAWKRADQAVQQSIASQADVKHIARLRDIDRLRYQADVASLSVQVSTLRGLTIGVSLALLAALIWLAVEIRRRRVLAAIIRMARPTDSDHPAESSDAATQSLIS